MKPEIAIIGGGYAGLACAVTLARSEKVRVTVFEAGRVLGGRARVVPREDGDIDNGQHILIGAYEQTLQLMRQVGVSPAVLESLPMTIRYVDGFHLQNARLPAPLHLALGLLRARGLDWADRFAAVRLIRHLKKCKWRLGGDRPASALLLDTGQTARIRERLWEPLCLAALNTPVKEASAQVFANILRDSLGAAASASELLIPRVDLSELFPVPATRWLGRRGHTVRTSDPIKSIRIEDGVFWLDGGPQWAGFNQVVIATAPYHAHALLRSFPELNALATQLEALRYQSTTTIYLRYPATVSLPSPMMGMCAGHAQWVFDRGQLGGPAGLLAVVISADGAHGKLSHAELELAVHGELEASFGRLPSPEWTRTIAEKRATFACTPGLRRPDNRTALAGLWLAGDYTDGPYPATLESATRSGVGAARKLLASL